jgi:uncharacterized protein YneF (UPF0154 family)
MFAETSAEAIGYGLGMLVGGSIGLAAGYFVVRKIIRKKK